MSQKVLLPSDEAAPGKEWKPSGPIPPRLRAFGKFPNIETWLPADLLLISSIEPDAVTRQIVAAQTRGGFSANDARWQHAAVYLGDGYVIEATLRGVRYAPIYSYLGGHQLRLRRPIGLDHEVRWKIAIQAAVRANEKYAVRSIAKLYAQSFRGLWKREKLLAARASTSSLICSQLYSDSYSAATGQLLTRTAVETITPAALSSSAAFHDVDLAWAVIPE